jgi:hypothetical protein
MDVNCNKPCEGCAFTPGAAANVETVSSLKGRICALGPIPFLCHHGKPWRNSEQWPKSKREAFAAGWTVCEGWKREVRRLADAGYYANAPEETRAFAEIALFNLDSLAEKRETRAVRLTMIHQLGDCIVALAKKEKEFLGRSYLFGLIDKLNERLQTKQKDEGGRK